MRQRLRQWLELVWSYVAIQVPTTEWFIVFLRRKHIEVVELFSGGGGAIYGIVLLAPVSTFATSPSYTAMATFPEVAWGLVALLVASAQLYTMRYNIMPYRLHAAYLMLALYLFISLAFFWSNPFGTWWAFYPLMFLGNVWTVCRLSVVTASTQ